MTTNVGNVMILASAGSGKTYALTNRFVRLLALGAKPDRIVALTFTRKAAGEFVDEIIKKLAEAASGEAYAARLSSEIGSGLLRSADFLAMLRVVVDAMPRLRLGTFDGFFARIARVFPLELGLSGDFEILQEHAAKVERARVLRRMFERTGDLGDAQKEFIEAFKRATFGVEEKRLGAQLDAFLDQHQEIFLNARDGDFWGKSDRIWPNGGAWLSAPPSTADALKALQAWVDGATLGDKQRTRWIEFIQAWREWSPGVVPNRPLAYVLEKALYVWSDVERGCAILEFDRKKQELTPLACKALESLTRHVVSTEIGRRMEMTRGIHAVLQGYESIYHEAVRRTGKLTFGDVQRLLMPSPQGPYPLSQDDQKEQRLFIDFRLDAEIDHWLLDEFQDTSYGQWSVLRNLIDEALQDPTGARSLFYVGDVKQAIFAWREGDPRLFREIFNHYNAVRPGIIAEEHLIKSWRSGPAVVDTVNQVFGDAIVLSHLFPGVASGAWNREWRDHESARLQVAGQVALLHGAEELDRFAITLAVLREIDPLTRGLSCGILVQSNQMAARLADYLRQEGGFSAVADADLHVCVDNPLGSALLALVKAAAYPGDNFAAEHVRMTPLGRLLTEEGLATPEAVTRRILSQLHTEGFERCMARWIVRLDEHLGGMDRFSCERGRQFTQAAALFDQTGSRDVADFIRFMERHVVREAEGASSLRVMTIHKSKGLGFDVVVLPDLEGLKLDCRRDGLAVQKSADRTVEWVLDLPAKLFHREDEVLASHVRLAEADACYESLSLLYVAMTRAKRAMYLVTKPVGSSTSRNFPKLLAETLGEDPQRIEIGSGIFEGAFVNGDRDWFVRLSPPPIAVTERIVGRVDADRLQRRPRLVARQPSSANNAEVKGINLFSLQQRMATSYGTAVHNLLAEVEWIIPGEVGRWAADWVTRELPAEAAAEALACLEMDTLGAVWFKRPNAEVWRERSFEVIMDGAWITGVFDRVVVDHDPSGRSLRATVFDFKTDRLTSAAELAEAMDHYSGQLNLYRRVVGVLLGTTPSHVSAKLVFTRLRKLVEVNADLSRL